MAFTKDDQVKATKGLFQVVGKLYRVSSEGAFKRKNEGTDKEFRMINLGLQISGSETMFLSLNGNKQKEVYFSKSSGKKGVPGETMKVEWKDRFKSIKDANLIGVSLGLVRKEGSETENDVQVMTPFDAYDYLRENAKDGMSVKVFGTIEFSSYDKDGEMKHMQKFVPSKIYLEKVPVNFEDEKFVKVAEFSQPAIFLGGNKDETGNYFTCGYVGYKSYETYSIEVDTPVYDYFKKSMKPNWAMTLTGEIKTSQIENHVQVQDAIGKSREVGVPRETVKTVLFVDGARPDTLEKDLYTAKIIEKYLSAIEADKAEREAAKSGFDSQEDSVPGKTRKISDEESAW